MSADISSPAGWQAEHAHFWSPNLRGSAGGPPLTLKKPRNGAEEAPKCFTCRGNDAEGALRVVAIRGNSAGDTLHAITKRGSGAVDTFRAVTIRRNGAEGAFRVVTIRGNGAEGTLQAVTIRGNDAEDALRAITRRGNDAECVLRVVTPVCKRHFGTLWAVTRDVWSKIATSAPITVPGRRLWASIRLIPADSGRHLASFRPVPRPGIWYLGSFQPYSPARYGLSGIRHWNGILGMDCPKNFRPLNNANYPLLPCLVVRGSGEHGLFPG